MEGQEILQQKNVLTDGILKVVDEDNETFLWRLRRRIDRVGIDFPKIEVRFEDLSVEGETYVGTRASPTLLNTTLNVVQDVLGTVGLAPTKKEVVKVLKDVNGIIKPSRLILLLGPPGSGKTTLLRALSGRLEKDLKVTGRVTYNGHEFSEFVPQKTGSYIGHHDLHCAEMTVRETLDFSARCLGAMFSNDMLLELSRREKEAGIQPDPDIDAFMKDAIETNHFGKNFITDYVLKNLGLDNCADITVGDEMRRGISGGEKKRLTTGEMLVGPARAFFMDGISTGLDSATTFRIVKVMREMVHILDMTMVMSLLQPTPETFDLFDDIILLSKGQIVYQGPRENVLEFFEHKGLRCTERKEVADFLQEVTSKKDQEHYWYQKDLPYQYIGAPDFVQAFNSFHIGKQLLEDLRVPFDKSSSHPAALMKKKYHISRRELFRACFSRECLLMKRNFFLYIFKCIQIAFLALIALTVFLRTTMHAGERRDAIKFWGALFFGLTTVMFNGMIEVPMTVLRLPVFYKQRDSLFYPAWAFGLPIWLLSIPVSVIESGIWIALTYYTIGFAPATSRLFKQFLAFFSLHQMALALFRFIGAFGRTLVIAGALEIFFFLMLLVLGGFVIAKDDTVSWIRWCSYLSPPTYGQNAISINEFLDGRWNTSIEPMLGKSLLKERSLYEDEYWYWISIGALLGYSVLLNFMYILALTFLNPIGDSRVVSADDASNHGTERQSTPNSEVKVAEGNASAVKKRTTKGMVLPFQPVSLSFNHVNYYVDMPKEMKRQGIQSNQLQLLRDISGAFRPGVLTALVGVTGAGKTTLMDVLAGRKTSGYTEGSISISGYPKNQATFARVCGYCEQNDIHSPYVTVYESLLYSAWLRLASDVKKETRKTFVEEVMELVELGPIRNALVGIPGVDGLSIEQRKRLTIAVELVANPSIIFMDEPTSGLDARAAAIVMRTVRNTVDTGRTVVCTIHQPSISIFEAFDELLLMKKGGQLIFAGPLGHHSHKLINYFEAIPGIPKIKEGYNPATWMLEISSSAVESQLGIDFADIYTNSELYQKNQELIRELSTPQPDSKDIYFPSRHSQNFINQCKACFWKQHWSYWRNSQYNVIRFFCTTMIGILFGLVFWGKGRQIDKQQDLFNLLGAAYAALLFLGASNASTVQSIIFIERTVFYREKASGMYSAFPYAFAQVAIEAIYVAIQSLVYALLLFSMMGFHWQADKFFYFYYFIFMCFTYFSTYGMMLVALTPSLQIAAIVMAFFMNIWNVFCGFFIPRPLIPIWWRWYYWANPAAWTIYGIIASQLGDNKSVLQFPELGSMPINTFLKSLGYDRAFLMPVVLGNVCWVLLFCFIFAISIKFLNFQRR